MKIVVFGAGGVGAFFGGLLAKAGADVHFVARGAQLDALRADGIRIHSVKLGDIQVPHVKAYERAADVGRADLVLVSVKANQTSMILDDLDAIAAERTVFVTLQNGVETDELLAARLGPHRVVPGIVYVGATLEAPGIVSHVAGGTILLGASSGFDRSRLDAVRDQIACSGQPVRIVDDVQLERWRKLTWNAAFNTVSALTGRTPRDLLHVPATRALLVGIMQEVIAVARAQGMDLHEAEFEEQLAWTERTSAIRTSMMVDRERGRAMETEALIGVVVRRGETYSVPTPLSGAVYALLMALEEQRTANS